MQRAAKACLKCGVRDCQKHKPTPRPRHKDSPAQTRARKAARPLRNTGKEIARRRACVAAYKAAHGDGHAAPCPRCGRVTADLVADHVVPVHVGGLESGPLRCLCRTCNASLGAALRRRPFPTEYKPFG